MKIKIKKLTDNTVTPVKAHPTDAGFDLVATSKVYDKYGNVSYGTGVAIEIPKGYAGFIFPRSSVSKYDLTLCNSVGIIDSCYRGEIMLKFKPTLSFFEDVKPDKEYPEPFPIGRDDYDYDRISVLPHDYFRDYNIGDKIGQLVIMPYPEVEFEESDELSDSERGEGGFGSTGV